MSKQVNAGLPAYEDLEANGRIGLAAGKVMPGDTAVGVSFGDWLARDAETIYQAATDGFVVVEHALFGAETYFEVRSDAATPPTTIRGRMRTSADTPSESMTVPIRQGHYWSLVRTVGTETPNVYWLPLEQGS